jgi:hypothetical protein
VRRKAELRDRLQDRMALLFGIEVPDCQRSFQRALTSSPSRSFHRAPVRGLDAQERLGRSGAVETFVGPDADVVNERRGEAPFEIGLSERQVKAVQVRGFLERSPEPLKASGGVEVLGGGEALAGSESSLSAACPRAYPSRAGNRIETTGTEGSRVAISRRRIDAKPSDSPCVRATRKTEVQGCCVNGRYTCSSACFTAW